MTVLQARRFLAFKQGYKKYALDDGCNIKPDDTLSEYGILVVEDWIKAKGCGISPIIIVEESKK